MKTKLRFLCMGVTLALIMAAVGASATVTIIARVDAAAGDIRARQVPAEFTVPAGQQAVNLRYSFHDPKSGMTRTTLGKNIYSITTGTYMVDAAGNALQVLPPGKYRFFVGGGPGASGSLTYDLAAAK